MFCSGLFSKLNLWSRSLMISDITSKISLGKSWSGSAQSFSSRVTEIDFETFLDKEHKGFLQKNIQLSCVLYLSRTFVRKTSKENGLLQNRSWLRVRDLRIIHFVGLKMITVISSLFLLLHILPLHLSFKHKDKQF